MEEGALVVIQARDLWPLPVIQDTASIDEDITVVVNDGAGCIVLDLYVVAAVLVVPVGANYLVLGLDVLVEVVLLGKALEVVEDLIRRGVDCRPVEIRLEAPGVVMGGDVAGAAIMSLIFPRVPYRCAGCAGAARILPWVSVLVPRSCYGGIFLVDCETEVVEVLLELICHEQSGRAGANTYHPDMPFGVNRGF